MLNHSSQQNTALRENKTLHEMANELANHIANVSAKVIEVLSLYIKSKFKSLKPALSSS